MRISIAGTSGAGKTTLAMHLAFRLAIPRIELDALNWEAGWRDLQTRSSTTAASAVGGRSRTLVEGA